MLLALTLVGALRSAGAVGATRFSRWGWQVLRSERTHHDALDDALPAFAHIARRGVRVGWVTNAVDGIDPENRRDPTRRGIGRAHAAPLAMLAAHFDARIDSKTSRSQPGRPCTRYLQPGDSSRQQRHLSGPVQALAYRTARTSRAEH